MKIFFLITVFLILLGSCDNHDEVIPDEPTIQINLGTGFFRYNYQTSNTSIPIDIYYHIPEADLTSMPITFIFHGNSRNAVEYRNAWIEKANNKEFIVIAPKFSASDFPGGDGYILGNVFEDGDNPSANSLNPEADWAFSVIEPLFDEVKSQLGNTSSTYNIFGFSAGAQFAHRFMLFKPEARANKIVASAAGWYTVPDTSITFPYGIDESPIEEVDPLSYFSKDFTLQIGTLDKDSNAPSLRRNAVVDQQGTNRYDRAYHMFNTSKAITEKLSVNFNWSIVETQGNDHDLEGSISQASDLLY